MHINVCAVRVFLTSRDTTGKKMAGKSLCPDIFSRRPAAASTGETRINFLFSV